MNNYQSKKRMRGGIGVVVVLFIYVVLAIVVICAIIWACIQDGAEQKRWDAFKTQHHCKIVAYMDGSTSVSTVPVVGSNGTVGVGTVTNTVPSKAAWVCDDAITYWKNQ